MVKFLVIICSLLSTVMMFGGCAAKMLTIEQQLLLEADSLFRAGNYEYAKIKFDKIRNTYSETDAAKTAQYNLGYINIFYDNPMSSPDGALREFKTFVTLYPQDVKVPEVNSWIRLLVSLKSFEKENDLTLNKYDKLKIRESKDNDIRAQIAQFRKLNENVNQEALKKCSEEKDSLSRKAKELENVIIDLERKCQDAGR